MPAQLREGVRVGRFTWDRGEVMLRGPDGEDKSGSLSRLGSAVEQEPESLERRDLEGFALRRRLAR